MKGRVLIVDDEASLCELLCDIATRAGFVADSCPSADDALAALAVREYDAVVTDIRMRAMNGLELCRRVAEAHPDVPVIVMTAFGSMETAVEALRAGAHDFVTKPVDGRLLVRVIERAVELRHLKRELQRLRADERSDEPDGDGLAFMGQSPAIARVAELVRQVAPLSSSVLITGESGTGKEVVARALHAASRRRHEPFVAVNVSAIPETLIESELFGHVKGAFTDAKEARAGLLVQAHKGTLFLDELGEMPLAMQAKLLRVLQERVVRPLGGEREVPFDTRIIAATNRDLEEAIEDGTFREDLYYRINVIHIEVPPLRARHHDVLLLARRFVKRFAEQQQKGVRDISPAAADKLVRYGWPGNVRELENAIERAVAVAQHDEIVVSDLPTRVRERAPAPAPAQRGTESDEPLLLADVERQHILRVLAQQGGNKRRTAELLGIGRKTLYRKLAEWGVAEDSEDG